MSEWNKGEIKTILEMILSTFGINLPETHYTDVTSFIEGRLKERSETPSEYVVSLNRDRQEYIRFVDAVTINESYFFRDNRHFSFLYDEVLTELFDQRRHVTIWSAASAAGEEALSLAAMCNALLNRFPESDYTVYASDINVSALQRMKEGKYTKSAFREDGAGFHSLLLHHMEEVTGGYVADEKIRKKIVIEEHNLFSDDYSKVPEDLDLVLLRNVFIYMPIENRNRILHNVVSKLREGGLLFLSASEVPLIWHPTLQVMERRGIYFFKRNTEHVPAEEIAKLKRAIEKPGAEAFQRKRKKETRHDRKEELAASSVPPAFNKIKMYECINHRLFNPLYEKSEDRENALSEHFVCLINYINQGEIEASEKVLAVLQKELPGNEAVDFYLGIVAKLKGNHAQSAAYFREAVEAEPYFWPARYELSMQMKGADPAEAAEMFNLCRRHITRYIERGRYTYHFLLDGFNALYFLKICEFWEKRLEADLP